MQSLTHELAAARRMLPVFDGGMANHWPMMLHALYALGANPAEVEAARTAYHQRALVPRSGLRVAAASDWRAHKGKAADFEAVLGWVSGAIAERGWASVAAELVPELMPSVGNDAFHALIRLGHGIAAHESLEIAHALAQWVVIDAPLRPLDAPWPAGAREPLPWLAAVLALPRPNRPDVNFPLIARRIHAWAHAKGFDAAATALAVPQGLEGARKRLDELAIIAARLYTHTGNFTVLHLITSLWALRLLLPHVSDPTQALRGYAVAMAAGAHAARLTPELADAALAQALPALPADTETAWQDAAERACTTPNDDHIAKLIYTTRAFHRATGEPWFLAAALCAR